METHNSLSTYISFLFVYDLNHDKGDYWVWKFALVRVHKPTKQQEQHENTSQKSQEKHYVTDIIITLEGQHN